MRPRSFQSSWVRASSFEILFLNACVTQPTQTKSIRRMDSSSIHLSGSKISGIRLIEGTLRITFSHAKVIKTMTGSAEKTLWSQAGELELRNVELLAPLPEQDQGAEFVCEGGDIDENIYTYRDMIPVPLDSRGHCRCNLKLRETDAVISAEAETIRLIMEATPKYIEHIRPNDDDPDL